MSLSLASNTINALGIFGRLSKGQEEYFDSLEKKYSQKPSDSHDYDIFRHLTLTFVRNAGIANVRQGLDLLHDLKIFFPVKLTSIKPFIKDESSMPGAEHIAIEFGLEQTKKLVEFVRQKVGSEITVATPYIKVVWFVPKTNQQQVIAELSDFKELIFTDFYLVANKQDEENTIFTTNSFFEQKN